jgi:hypothetical protein
MKNLLLILPLSMMMTAMSAQDTKKMDNTKMDKTPTVATLDGKSFKITLMSRNTDDTKMNGTSDAGKPMQKENTDVKAQEERSSRTFQSISV